MKIYWAFFRKDVRNRFEWEKHFRNGVAVNPKVVIIAKALFGKKSAFLPIAVIRTVLSDVHSIFDWVFRFEVYNLHYPVSLSQCIAQRNSDEVFAAIVEQRGSVHYVSLIVVLIFEFRNLVIGTKSHGSSSVELDFISQSDSLLKNDEDTVLFFLVVGLNLQVVKLDFRRP